MSRLHFLRSHNEMDHAVRRRDEEAVKIFAQLLNFIPPRDAMNLQERGGRFRVIRLQLEPDIGMTQVWHAIDPKPVRTELKNAAVFFLFDQRQYERVPIKSHGLLIGVTWALDGDVCAA